MGRHPNWLSAKDKRILRDANDQRSRYSESIGDGDFDGNHLSTASSGEGRWENETLSRDNG
jgi:hypothetical protein